MLWPSIRSQERRARRLETWIDGPEGQRLKIAALSKIEKADGLDAAGKPVNKDAWSRGLQQAGDL